MGKYGIKVRNARGSGIKFKLETFRTVANFTPLTRIKYGPNKKLPGSKSFDRYERYRHATTVGEALKLGSLRADLCYELERGMYKILGGPTPGGQLPQLKGEAKRDYERCVKELERIKGPNGLATALTDERGEEQLAKEEAWRGEKLARVQKLAKEFGIVLESEEDLQAAGIHETADIRAQRRVADELARRRLEARMKCRNKKITETDMTEVLRVWGFLANVGRVNVLPDGHRWVYSDTLGAIRRRTGGWGVTPSTLHYPNVSRLFVQWLKDNKPPVRGKFVFTSINVNANYAARLHRDQNNEGPSAIRAFGEFKGGRLHYWPKDDPQQSKRNLANLKQSDAKTLDIKKATFVFDGRHGHSVEAFTGERFSLVYFTARGYGKANPKDVAYVKSLGFPWPTPADVAALKDATEAIVH